MISLYWVKLFLAPHLMGCFTTFFIHLARVGHFNNRNKCDWKSYFTRLLMSLTIADTQSWLVKNSSVTEHIRASFFKVIWLINSKESWKQEGQVALNCSLEFCLKLTHRYLLKTDHVPCDTWGGATFGLRGIIWTNLVEVHQVMLHRPQGRNLNKFGRGPQGDATYQISML